MNFIQLRWYRLTLRLMDHIATVRAELGGHMRRYAYYVMAKLIDGILLNVKIYVILQRRYRILLVIVILKMLLW